MMCKRYWYDSAGKKYHYTGHAGVLNNRRALRDYCYKLLMYEKDKYTKDEKNVILSVYKMALDEIDYLKYGKLLNNKRKSELYYSGRRIHKKFEGVRFLMSRDPDLEVFPKLESMSIHEHFEFWCKIVYSVKHHGKEIK